MEVKMKQLENFIGNATKIKGSGPIEYELWFDGNGTSYVRIVGNEIVTNEPGTFSKLLFSVNEYSHLRNSNSDINPVCGYDLSTRTTIQSKNNDDGAFLKAVLRDLLP
jgi:hypothetical protein